jgi:hypothetical protein
MITSTISIAVHETQDLPVLLVHAEEPGRAVPAGSLEQTEELAHEAVTRRAPYRVADADHDVNPPPRSGYSLTLPFSARLNRPPGW